MHEAQIQTLLVVDDQHHTRHFLRNVLHRAGYHVLEATDRDSACCAVKQHSGGAVALALIDVDLDGDSGPLVAESVQRLTPVPVLFMSGYSRAQLVDDQQIPSDAHFLPKPFTVGAVLAAVAAIVREAPQVSEQSGKS